MIEEPTCDVANSIYDDSNNSGEILCEDGGANLVIWKSLLTPKSDSKEYRQHTSIFHLTYTIKIRSAT